MIGTLTLATPSRPRWIALRRALLLGLALSAAVAVRVALNGSSAPTAMTAGAVLGLALIGIALRSGLSVRQGDQPRQAVGALGLGVVGGLVLVVLPGLLQPLSGAGLGLHPQPFAVWVLVTAIVAVGEESVLRGVLFDAVTEALGRPAAVLVTSVGFALIHVPLYGWHVVPLDLAVGFWLAGLRLVSGGIAAPAVAHVLADLATWWM